MQMRQDWDIEWWRPLPSGHVTGGSRRGWWWEESLEASRGRPGAQSARQPLRDTSLRWTETASPCRSTTWGSRQRWRGGRSQSLSRRKFVVFPPSESRVWASTARLRSYWFSLTKSSRRMDTCRVVTSVILFQHEGFHRRKWERRLFDSFSR